MHRVPHGTHPGTGFMPFPELRQVESPTRQTRLNGPYIVDLPGESAEAIRTLGLSLDPEATAQLDRDACQPKEEQPDTAILEAPVQREAHAEPFRVEGPSRFEIGAEEDHMIEPAHR